MTLRRMYLLLALLVVVLVACGDGEQPGPTTAPPPPIVASAPLQPFFPVSASPAPAPQSKWYDGQILGKHPTWRAVAKNLTGRPQIISLCAMIGIGLPPNPSDKGMAEQLFQPGEQRDLGPVQAQACGRIEVELKGEPCAVQIDKSIFIDAEIYEVACPTPCVEDDDARTPPCPPPCDDESVPCPGKARP